MPRKARMVVKGEASVYHVISRTALDGFVLGDVEKDFLLNLIRELSAVYFAEVLGFCIMGNHFHLVVRMRPGEGYSDEELKKRFLLYYKNDPKRLLMPDQIPTLRCKLESLSQYMKEIKQGFSRFYNRRHKRKGFFWSERFKSVIVEEGETLINCLVYVDLNPVRANIVERPDDYRWSSLGYHLQTNNKGSFLSLDFGLIGPKWESKKARLQEYRRFVYEKGSLADAKGKQIRKEIFDEESRKNFETGTIERFRLRTRYFTDSGIIGSREFVRKCALLFHGDGEVKEKIPRSVSGLNGVYSLKRLSEKIL